MPQTDQEKTEVPTPRRRQEARQGGQIGKSSDLSAAVVLLGALVLLRYAGGDMFRKLLTATAACLGGDGVEMADPDQMLMIFGRTARLVAGVVLPVMLLVVVLALLASFVQVGFLFTLKPMTPSLGKLNPINGLKRMFSARSFVTLLMGIGKMSLLAAVACWTLRGRVEVFALASSMHHLTITGMAAELIYIVGLRLAIVLLLLALIDYAYQKHKTEKELKMTKQEVRDELKNMEGDPKIKHKRRQMQMQVALQRIQAAVPQADVVVTNPTELAIAIRYDAETMIAPKVTAKGADLLAKRIREIAIAHGVPIVERKPLARMLYRQVEIGQEIPAQFYRAVAEILAYVYELSGKARTRRSARAAG